MTSSIENDEILRACGDKEILQSDEIHFINKPIGMENDADLLNVIPIRRVKGDSTIISANSRRGYAISRRGVHHFGSIEDFSIDTYPMSMIRCKGTEITQIERRSKTFSGKAFLSRHFLSKVLMWWAYVMHIRYTERIIKVEVDGSISYFIDDRDINRLNAVNLWKKSIGYDHKIVGRTVRDDFGNRKVEMYSEPLPRHHQVDCLTGEDTILMLHDLIFLTRNKTPEDMDREFQKGRLSEQFYTLLRTMASEKQISYQEVFQTLKERLYYDEQLGEAVWSYPKIPIEYLQGVIEELQSGYYHTDLLIPLVHRPFKYPLKCTSLTADRPKTDEEHKRAKSDYEIGQYIFEDREC